VDFWTIVGSSAAVVAILVAIGIAVWLRTVARRDATVVRRDAAVEQSREAAIDLLEFLMNRRVLWARGDTEYWQEVVSSVLLIRERVEALLGRVRADDRLASPLRKINDACLTLLNYPRSRTEGESDTAGSDFYFGDPSTGDARRVVIEDFRLVVRPAVDEFAATLQSPRRLRSDEGVF
jgi:hypothetical protein